MKKSIFIYLFLSISTALFSLGLQKPLQARWGWQYMETNRSGDKLYYKIDNPDSQRRYRGVQLKIIEANGKSFTKNRKIDCETWSMYAPSRKKWEVVKSYMVASYFIDDVCR